MKHLWDLGRPASVRDVMERVNQQAREPRAYTSVMSLLQVMAEKGLLERMPEGRAFLYAPVQPRESTLRALLGETLDRVYDGSASLLVAHLLDQSRPDSGELEQIRELLDAYQRRQVKTSANHRKGGQGCGSLRSTD